MNPAAPKKNRRVPLTNAALLLMGTALVGQVLGFLRTMLVNANFATTGPHSIDAYFIAFNIPDFFFFTLSAGALGVAFMPILSDHLHKGDRKGAWELSASLMNLLVIVMAVVGVALFVFAEPLARLITSQKIGETQIHEAATIMRFLAFNPLLFTISGVLTSVQQTMGRFFFYAIAPLFYNLTIIASAVVFSTVHGHHGGPMHLGLTGLGVGALIGAVLQLVVVVVGMKGLRYRWHPRIMWRNSDFHLVLRQLPPRSLDQGMDQLESIVETRFATRLASGAVTYYNDAYVLSTAPVLLLGTAISTAAFPRLNARLSQGRPDLFRRDFLKVMRVLIWLALPVVIIAYYCRGYLARLIYKSDAPEIALVLGYLTLAIFFRTLYSLISRWFYAQKDTKTPLFVSVFTISLNIFLAYSLSRPNSYGLAGLALAQSIVAVVEVAILSVIMIWRDHRLLDVEFWRGVMRIISVTGFSVVAGYIMISLYPLGARDRGFFTLGSKLFAIALVVFAVHIAMSGLFGLSEVRPFFKRATRFILKPINVE